MITGLGAYLPERVVTNHDLSQMMNTTDRFIVERTGIVTRRYASAETSASDLGLLAAQDAIRQAGISKDKIDLILVNTITPDHHDPGTAYFLQEKLGVNGCAAIDLRGQCAGFIYGLVIAEQFIAAGTYEHVLVVASEVLSKRVDSSDEGRNMAILLGDGAGAAVVSQSGRGGFKVLAHRLGADGKRADALWTEAPGTGMKGAFCSPADLAAGRGHFRMHGSSVFETAVNKLSMVASQVLAGAGHSLDDIDWCVPHQANLRIIEAVTKRLGIPASKVLTNVERVGNTASASIPIMMSEALDKNLFRRGDKILTITFGGGFVWGGMLLEVIRDN